MDIKEAIMQRRSIRKFEDEKVEENDILEIIELARRAPSSVNGQQISLIYTMNKDLIEKIASLSGGQAQISDSKAFIAIIGDFYRDKIYLESVGKSLTDDIHNLREIASVDAGIMATILNFAAMSKGLGCTIIGGVKQEPKKIAKLLNLPEGTFVLLGLTIGVPAKGSMDITLKPRIARKAFEMKDKYNAEVQNNAIKEYEGVLDKWFRSINVDQPLFGKVIERFYAK